MNFQVESSHQPLTTLSESQAPFSAPFWVDIAFIPLFGSHTKSGQKRLETSNCPNDQHEYEQLPFPTFQERHQIGAPQSASQMQYAQTVCMVVICFKLEHLVDVYLPILECH